jgi:ubiquitin-like protein ATG12
MSTSQEERIPDENDTTEAPLTMAASVVLTNLPRDASKALETAGNLTVQKSKIPSVSSTTSFRPLTHLCIIYTIAKYVRRIQPEEVESKPQSRSLRLIILPVTVRLQPIGSAPHLNQRVFKLSTNQRFDTIVRFLRKKLGVKEHESVFCYVGSVFSPALDEGVGNLWTVGLGVLYSY